MTKSLAPETPQFFPGSPKSNTGTVNYEGFARNDGLFKYRTTNHGVQGVAGSNPAVPTGLAVGPTRW
jgi:hypothetical protein